MEIGDYVTVRGYAGIAFVVCGYPEVWAPWIACDPETGEEFETEEGEWVEDCESGRIVCRMVGDDKLHEVKRSDCKPIADEDFCGECGQIGCSWGR